MWRAGRSCCCWRWCSAWGRSRPPGRCTRCLRSRQRAHWQVRTPKNAATQEVQPASARADPQQCSCARAHATPDVQVSCARHGCGCGVACAAARVACAACRKYGAARALARAAAGQRVAPRRRQAGRGHRAADPRNAPRVVRQRRQQRSRARARRAAAVRARKGRVAARARARTWAIPQQSKRSLCCGGWSLSAITICGRARMLPAVPRCVRHGHMEFDNRKLSYENMWDAQSAKHFGFCCNCGGTAATLRPFEMQFLLGLTRVSVKPVRTSGYRKVPACSHPTYVG